MLLYQLATQLFVPVRNFTLNDAIQEKREKKFIVVIMWENKQEEEKSGKTKQQQKIISLYEDCI